ncbi:MAG: GNAT family N-acetyltransferase [Cellulosilyticaceae bacterium]
MQILQIFFRIYIDIYGKYGDVVATSEDLGGLAYIFYEERFKNNWIIIKDSCCSIFRVLDLLKFMNIREIYHMFKSLKRVSRRWINSNIESDYIHLDLIVVKEEARGHGKCKQIIGYIINEASTKNIPITLETQNPCNVEMYKHFGFEVVEVMDADDSMRYCMMKKL